MGQFDPFANQGGPAAESEDALAEARRRADEQLRTADYSVDLPEPLSGGASSADAATGAEDPAAEGAAASESATGESGADDAPGGEAVGEPDSNPPTA